MSKKINLKKEAAKVLLRQDKEDSEKKTEEEAKKHAWQYGNTVRAQQLDKVWHFNGHDLLASMYKEVAFVQRDLLAEKDEKKAEFLKGKLESIVHWLNFIEDFGK